MRYYGMLLLLVQSAGCVDVSDIPSFRFTCWATNSLEPLKPPPLDPPPPSPPAECAAACPEEYQCVDGVCCTDVRSVGRMVCVDNSSAYGFVLGGIDSTFGLWYVHVQT